MIDIYICKDVLGIYESLCLFDMQFPRSLSGRVGCLESYAKKLYDNSYFLIAEESGDIKGFAAFYANNYIDKVAFLAQIAVDINCRGLGISSLLLCKCEEISYGNGMKSISLEVDNSNIRAINFYVKHGYSLHTCDDVSSIYLKKLFPREQI